MGMSTDATICYGVLFDSNYEFPWDEQGLEIDDWWIDTSGYEFVGVGGTEYERSSREYSERAAWLASHSLPVALVNVCSGEYPIYVVAVPSTVLTAHRGEPVEFNPLDLAARLSRAIEAQEIAAFYSFLLEHLDDDPLSPPAIWYLSSYKEEG